MIRNSKPPSRNQASAGGRNDSLSITAVIPCYNAGEYIAEAIESVIGQTRPVDEIIVVDDCSTDDSCDVAMTFPVKLLKTNRNSGHATARNLGIHEACGDVIVWLDADDFFDPNHVEVVSGLLDRYESAAVAFTEVRQFGEGDGIIGNLASCVEESKNIFWECLRCTVVPAMSAATRREPLLKIGGFNPAIRVAPDFDLWLRLARGCEFVRTNQVTSNYRRHARQISQNRLAQQCSVYQARWRMYESVMSDGQFDLAEFIANEIRGIWKHDLNKTWKSRELNFFKLYCSLSHLVPEYHLVMSEFSVRSRLPHALIRGWDSVRKLRRRCSRFARSVAVPSRRS